MSKPRKLSPPNQSDVWLVRVYATADYGSMDQERSLLRRCIRVDSRGRFVLWKRQKKYLNQQNEFAITDGSIREFPQEK
jgi:hypothetical protein